MSNLKGVLAFEALRSVAVAAAYTNLGTPLVHPIRILKINNESTAAITVSFDGGTTDHEHIPANSFVLIDICSNRVDSAELVISANTQVAVKGAGAGTIFMSTYYAT